MSIPLVDFRCKVTPEIDSLLEAKHRITGLDKSEIARDVLQKWAVAEIHVVMMVYDELKSKGILGDYKGATGK
jgi:hypothetical protein